jgi:putative ABC transport system permease protein
VAVITATLARRLFPDRSPVGRTLGLTRSTGTFEVVGVVGDVRMGELDRDVLPAFYTCSLQDPSRSAQLVVRTGVPAGELATSVRGVVAGIDAEVPVYAVRTLDEARGGTRGVAVRRLVYYPLLLFGALAAAIAAVGVYALVSQAVAERTSELGIRLALGASPSGIRQLVLREGLAPVVAGIVIGLAASAWAARALGAMLYEISPGDPLTFAAAAAGLLLIAAAAAAGPAIRATRLDPLAAIRSE